MRVGAVRARGAAEMAMAVVATAVTVGVTQEVAAMVGGEKAARAREQER